MKGTAEVTTLTLSMTPQEAQELAEAASAAVARAESEAANFHGVTPPTTADMAERYLLERLIAALGMGLANCPRSEPEEPVSYRHDDYCGGCDSCRGDE
jgi:hypothetical protein